MTLKERLEKCPIYGDTPLMFAVIAASLTGIAGALSFIALGMSESNPLYHYLPFINAICTYGAGPAALISVVWAAAKAKRSDEAMREKLSSAEERIARLEGRSRQPDTHGVVIAKFCGSPLVRVGERSHLREEARQLSKQAKRAV